MTPIIKQFFNIFLVNKKHSFSYQNHYWKQIPLLVKQVDYWALISFILPSKFFAR